jgi:hypothetical protein
MGMLTTKEKFLQNVLSHEMTIVRDDGANRHLRFRRTDEPFYWFDLITWPGFLCVTGDCGTYVFQRLEDMFCFFRGENINPGYWGEKMQAADKTGGYKEFSSDLFRAAVGSHFNSFFEGFDRKNPDRAEWWERVRDEVLFCDNEIEAVHSIWSFGHSSLFADFWENEINEYTHSYIWNLYAIIWGIQQYDEAKKAGS